MRLGVIVLLLATALAVASAPAFGQSSAVPSEEKKGEGPKNDKEANKAAKEDKKAKGGDDEGRGPGEEGDEGDDGDDDEGEEGGGGGDDDEGEEGDGGGGEGDDATGQQPGGGGSGGDTGSGGGGSGGQDSGHAKPTTSDHGSPVVGGQSPLVNDLGCRQECDSPNHRTVEDGDAADLAATGGPGGLDRDAISLAAVEDEGQFQEGRFALGPATTADGNPGAFALLTLAAMVLLVGLVGGLRALHSRLSES
jgi:hypothetical protein